MTCACQVDDRPGSEQHYAWDCCDWKLALPTDCKWLSHPPAATLIPLYRVETARLYAPSLPLIRVTLARKQTVQRGYTACGINSHPVVPAGAKWQGARSIGAGGDHSYAVAARGARFARPRNGFRSGFSRRSRQSTCRFSRSTALRVCEAMIPKAPTSSPGACSSPRAATRCSTGNGGKRRSPGNRSSSASPPRGWSPSTAACAPRADTRPASKANALPEPLSTESGQTRPLPRTPRPHDRTRTTRAAEWTLNSLTTSLREPWSLVRPEHHAPPRRPHTTTDGGHVGPDSGTAFNWKGGRGVQHD